VFKVKWFDTTNYIFLLFVAFLTIYPLWHQVSLSFSSISQALRGGLFFWPRDFTFVAYSSLLRFDYLWIAYMNTITITVVGTLITVLLSSMTAYPLIKKMIPGQRIFIILILFTMLFQGGLIPTYILINSMGLTNSLWSIILPTAISGFYIVVMMSFFRTLPVELEESAMMDGANPTYIFFKIIIPLSMPVLVTIALWEAVSLWNNYIYPLIFLSAKEKYTLPILLRDIINGQEIARQTGEIVSSSTESVIAATIVMSTLPILMVYPFLQKHFAKGALIGSVKQ